MMKSMCVAHARPWSKVTPMNFTVFSNLILTSLIFRMISVGMYLLRVKRKATVYFTEILKPHSSKYFTVFVR